MTKRMLIPVLLALVALASCGGGDGGVGTASGSVTVSEGPGKPTVTIPAGDPPATLQTTDITLGIGAEAKAGTEITVHYLLAFWSTKKTFQASWDTGSPVPFQLGVGAVIKGWDQGVPGMKIGGRRLLVVPPDLGYGAGGNGIPPNETLVFVVDLLAVK